MLSRARATIPHLVCLLLFLSPAALHSARADDLTGLAQDDEKDLLPPSSAQAPSGPCYNPGFVPMPSWARGVVLPPLPEVLKPMGKKPVLTTPPVPATTPLAPPKDSGTPTVVVAKPTVVPQPAPNPALIAVSPFLDWIKANPQAAAEQARQQAGAYQAADPTGATTPAPAPNTASNNNTAPNNSAAAPLVVTPAPYWMPPLIDTAPFTSTSGNISGSGAAIYSTPQR
jgi:hypothetical protein